MTAMRSGDTDFFFQSTQKSPDNSSNIFFGVRHFHPKPIRT
jgi:hypothetical protein